MRKFPYWLKSGLTFGIIVALAIIIIPDDMIPDVDDAPWYLQIIMIPVFIVFTYLCIIFGVDFVSNYHPDEGMYRRILLPTFSVISFFIVSFIVGSLVALIMGFLIKKIKKNFKEAV